MPASHRAIISCRFTSRCQRSATWIACGAPWLMPLALLGCYALWCRADLMLFDWPAKAAEPARS